MAGQVLIDKLLATVIQLKASDLHISVGQPPVIRHHGRHAQARHQGSRLGRHHRPDEVDHARPLPAGVAGEGRGDFAIELRRRLPVPRRHLQAEGHHRHGAAAHPEPVPDVRADWHARRHPLADRPAARSAPRHRPDRLRQDDQPGVDDQLHQRQLRPAHHHAGRPDRVLTTSTRSARSTSARSASTCPDFKEGIRRALRMDPDVILVGEMRDLETIHAAIEAAETGHIVFGTLHTSGAASHDQPHHRRVPEGPAGPDPHAAVARP